MHNQNPTMNVFHLYSKCPGAIKEGVGRLLFLVLFLPFSLTVSAQSWEQVKVNPDYIIGEGTGATLDDEQHRKDYSQSGA